MRTCSGSPRTLPHERQGGLHPCSACGTCGAPGGAPAARLRRMLGIFLIANKTGNSLLLDSLLFHTPPLCIVQYVPWGLFFFFLSPPPPLLTPVCWGLMSG